MLRTLKSALTLSHRDRRAVLEAVVLMIAMRRRLRRDGMETLLSRLSEQPHERTRDVAACGDVSKALSRGKKLLFGRPTCLEQALAGGMMLQRRNQNFVISIGMRRSDEGMVGAHAWLHSGDRILCGGALSPSRFTAIARFPAS